jgi:hypothetical protein
VIETADAADFDAVDTALESVASYSGGTADHLTAQLGASSNRQDVFGGTVDAQSASISPQSISVYGGGGNHLKTFQVSDYADAGAAIQAVHDNEMPDGGEMKLGPGAYSLATQPVITKDINLIGSGADQDGNGGTILSNPRTDGSAAIVADGLQGVEWANVQIKGATNQGDVGLHVRADDSNCRDMTLREVLTRETGSHGIYLDSTNSTGTIFGASIIGCRTAFTDLGHGLWIDGGAQVRLFGGYYATKDNGSSYNAIFTKNARNVSLFGTTAAQASKFGLRMQGGEGHHIGSLHAENSQTGSTGNVQLGVTGNLNGLSAGTIRTTFADGNGLSIRGSNISIQEVTEHDNSGTPIQMNADADNVTIEKVNGSVGFVDTAATDIIIGDDPTFNGARGVAPSGGSLSLTFAAAFSSKPMLDVTTEGEALWWVSSWSTNGDGNYDGATLSFVDASGASVNPTVHWSASVR